MGRVTSEIIQKLTSIFELLPEDARKKCVLCNETLAHIVKKAEAETKAGTSTVTRILADNINKDAAPGDRVTGESLRQRVLERSGEKKRICSNGTNKSKPANPASTPQSRDFHSAFEYHIEKLAEVEQKFDIDEIHKRLTSKEYSFYRDCFKTVIDLLKRIEKMEI